METLISAVQDRGWGVGAVATPLGLGFIDEAPARFNTVNGWAAGISGTLALGILCEVYGLGIPTAVLPYVNSAMAALPAYGESLARLRAMGARISGYEPHPSKSGGGADCFRWEEALELLAPSLACEDICVVADNLTCSGGFAVADSVSREDGCRPPARSTWRRKP